MSISKPNFVDSPYFEFGEDGWKLKDGAPEEVRKEFEEYIQYEEDLRKRGIEL